LIVTKLRNRLSESKSSQMVFVKGRLLSIKGSVVFQTIGKEILKFSFNAGRSLSITTTTTPARLNLNSRHFQ
jgi:hypothetical protein